MDFLMLYIKNHANVFSLNTIVELHNLEMGKSENSPVEQDTKYFDNDLVIFGGFVSFE